MKINKQELQTALGLVKPGLATKEVIEQSTSFAFMGGRVVTYNDEISLSHPVPGLELEGAIESDKLYQLLTKIKQEEIDIEVEGNEVIITAGKAKAGLTLQTEISLPLDEALNEKGKWKPIPDGFLKFVALCIPSCARQATKPMLGAVHVKEEGVIEASDGYRITRCSLPEEGAMPVASFLLPASSARQMLSLQPTKIAEGKGWIHFKTAEGTVLSCRILEGDEYPDTTPHMVLKGAKPIIFPGSIIEIMNRASVFSKDESGVDSIEIRVEPKRMHIKAQTELGWFKEEVNTKYDGEPLEFKINPALLQGILSETQTGELTKNKLAFRLEGWEYMTVLQAIQ
jgi:DNA polymerase III sliding clamp (beta) subunit (PCNA family)